MKNLLKQFSTTNRLLAESTNKLQFLLNCRSHNLIPQHIYNLYGHQIKNVTFFSKTCKNKFNNFNKYCLSKLLKLEIQDINFHINFLNKSQKKHKNKITATNPNKNINDKFFYRPSEKFYSVRQNCLLKYKTKFESLQCCKQKQFSPNNDDWFINLTNAHIPSDIIDIVSLGPNFSITPLKISQNNVIDIIKNTELSLQKLDINYEIKDEIRQKVTNIINHNGKKKNFMFQLKIESSTIS